MLVEYQFYSFKINKPLAFMGLLRIDCALVCRNLKAYRMGDAIMSERGFSHIRSIPELQDDLDLIKLCFANYLISLISLIHQETHLVAILRCSHSFQLIRALGYSKFYYWHLQVANHLFYQYIIS